MDGRMSIDAHTTHEPQRAQLAGWTHRVFTHPRLILWTGVGLLVLFGWLYLAVMLVALGPHTGLADAGPGMGLLSFLDAWIALDPLTRDLLASLCAPASIGYGLDGAPGWSPLDFALVFAMWAAMTLAMMVPTAAPMITAYADISLTAREKGIETVPTAVLLAGYLAVWLGFCIAAVAAQWLLASLSLLSPTYVVAHRGIAAAVLVVAGLYQFTPMKHACLVKCRTPLPFFMAHWSNEVAGVFRMGLRQGAVCVACCWALMAVMFAAGLMNVVWMAALAVVMALEKILPDPRFVVRATGIALIVAGAGFLVPGL
jgi:predicted metal-binding membrane protein